FNLPGIIAFIIALLVALAVKSAFMDSFVLTRTMAAYMGVAPTTTITFDLYGKLSGISKKFKSLFTKGQEEDPGSASAQAAPSAAADTAYTAAAPLSDTTAQAAPGAPTSSAPLYTGEKSVFCTQCGAKNSVGAKFCVTCGAEIKA
ncbi:MAG: zinc ribbon domain-containing protein, partial [Oscillospiraceae bacterium]|nr:zinc ribbon domain-containing protein [Oscillospiraceae bacterium]